MVYLSGGPSHIDTYDMKPDAPAEIRGEFKPIRTNVPGFDICELMPLQAQDRRQAGRRPQPASSTPSCPRASHELFTGFREPPGSGRPPFGSVVSKLRAAAHGDAAAATSASTADRRPRRPRASPPYLGLAHQPFVPRRRPWRAWHLPPRRHARPAATTARRCCAAFDTLPPRPRRAPANMAGMDAFTAQALEMITSRRPREAFDLSKEPDRSRERYGRRRPQLPARRQAWHGSSSCWPGGWSRRACRWSRSARSAGWDHHGNSADSHGTIFERLRRRCRCSTSAVHALVTDLHERGLDKDVAVVVWGEFGRTPKINPDGRPRPLAAGRLRAARRRRHQDGPGRSARPTRAANGPSGKRSTRRRTCSPRSTTHLGIDPATTLFADHTAGPLPPAGRPRADRRADLGAAESFAQRPRQPTPLGGVTATQ